MNTDSATRSPFNRVFRAMLSSSIYGDTNVVVRRMVGDRVFVEMSFAPVLRSMTLLHFQHVHEDGEVTEILAECEVMGWHSRRGDLDWMRIIELRIVGFAQTMHDDNPDHIH